MGQLGDIRVYPWGAICPELFLYSFSPLPGSRDGNCFASTHAPQPDGRPPLEPWTKVNLSSFKLFHQELVTDTLYMTKMTLFHWS